MSNPHPIKEVVMLDEHVRLFVNVADVEYQDVPNRLPSKLLDQYQHWLARARGSAAIHATMAWASGNVSGMVPEDLWRHAANAEKSLTDLDVGRAAASLRKAEQVMVADVPHGLTLQDMAKIACMSSTLTIVAELLMVGMSCDFQEQPSDTWALTADGATEDDVVPVAAVALRSLRNRLPELATATAEQLRDLLLEAEPCERPALLMLSWAVESGAVTRIGARIEASVAESGCSRRAWVHRFIVADGALVPMTAISATADLKN